MYVGFPKKNKIEMFNLLHLFIDNPSIRRIFSSYRWHFRTFSQRTGESSAVGTAKRSRMFHFANGSDIPDAQRATNLFDQQLRSGAGHFNGTHTRQFERSRSLSRAVNESKFRVCGRNISATFRWNGSIHKGMRANGWKGTGKTGIVCCYFFVRIYIFVFVRPKSYDVKNVDHWLSFHNSRQIGKNRWKNSIVKCYYRSRLWLLDRRYCNWH